MQVHGDLRVVQDQGGEGVAAGLGNAQVLSLRSQHAGVFLDGGAHEARVLDRHPPGPLIQGFAESSDIDPAVAAVGSRAGNGQVGCAPGHDGPGPTPKRPDRLHPATDLSGVPDEAGDHRGFDRGRGVGQVGVDHRGPVPVQPACGHLRDQGGRTLDQPDRGVQAPGRDPEGDAQDGRDQLGRIRPVLQPAMGVELGVVLVGAVGQDPPVPVHRDRGHHLGPGRVQPIRSLLQPCQHVELLGHGPAPHHECCVAQRAIGGLPGGRGVHT